MRNEYLCIHGHFYQPPRENPWVESIEYQDSAKPYHDWNHRITRECYGPNARARVHGHDGHILKLVNNYAYMSFNFGPTLLSWLEDCHPWVYAQILAADQASRIRYEGHGNALAQVYNHIVMPLANRRDKRTQIRWGVADFKRRFGRSPEGMWLAETAVDTETLKLMSEEGIRFTILSPEQAKAVRSLAGESKKRAWQDVSGGRIDPTRPYRVIFGKAGQSFMDVFFYNASLSRAVAYEKILESGEGFLLRIEQAFGERRDGPRLVSVATDGESYGHHFKFGDLALSWLFDHIEQTRGIKLTNYAFFLEKFPPQNEVKLFENSSWSCAHGVERWRSDCGCNVDHTPGWNQAWRTPLREGLDRLAKEIGAIFEKRGGRLLKDPWEARDAYIKVLMDPSDAQRERFLRQYAVGPPGKKKATEAWRLLESQRMALYMFTSCGWFFDDISGLEAAQVLKYAARAIELVEGWAGKDLEAELLGILRNAESNHSNYGHGDQVYRQAVKASRMDPSRATAHYALAALETEHAQKTCVFSEIVQPLSRQRVDDSQLHALLGEVRVVEKMTGRVFGRAYAAIRREGKDLRCWVGNLGADSTLEQLAQELRSTVREKTWEDINGIVLGHISDLQVYTLKNLMADTRKCIIESLAHDVYHRIKQSINAREGDLGELLFLLEETEERLPAIMINLFRLQAADALFEVLESGHGENPVDWSQLRFWVNLAKRCDLKLNEAIIKKKSQAFLQLQLEHLASHHGKASIENIFNFLNLAQDLNIELDLWHCQNIFYDLQGDSEFADKLPAETAHAFQELGQRLGFPIQGE
jgi:alpha-amylase/alpha-mannosidase (GH57 family)